MYHSRIVDLKGVSKACGCPLLPLKNQTTNQTIGHGHAHTHAPRLSDQGLVSISFYLMQKNVLIDKMVYFRGWLE